jgi:hypothetical protein
VLKEEVQIEVRDGRERLAEDVVGGGDGLVRGS